MHLAAQGARGCAGLASPRRALRGRNIGTAKSSLGSEGQGAEAPKPPAGTHKADGQGPLQRPAPSRAPTARGRFGREKRLFSALAGLLQYPPANQASPSWDVFNLLYVDFN